MSIADVADQCYTILVRLFWYLSHWSGSICSIFCNRLYCKDIHCVQWPNNIIFRNKTFLFFKMESWNFPHLFEKEFCNLIKFQLNQTSVRKNVNNKCLNELNDFKFCEVSTDTKKFQLSFLKNNGIMLSKLFLPTVTKKLFYWSRKTFEIRGWRPRICKIFEIIWTIYSNSERSEKLCLLKQVTF